MNDTNDRDGLAPETSPEGALPGGSEAGDTALGGPEGREAGGQDLEERVIEKLLEGDPLTVPLGDSEAERALTREYIEVLGALPAGLEPVEPAPELKERLLGAIRAAGAPDGGPDGGPGGERAPVAAFPRPAPAPAVSRWPLALAASVALLLAGLAAYLGSELRDARSEVGRLAAQVEELSTEPPGDEATPGSGFRPAAVSAEEEMRLARMLDDQAMLCKLWPPEDAPHVRDVRGLLVIDSEGSGWAIEVAGLKPAPSGMAYRVWFLTDRGPVAAGILSFDGARAEAGSGRVPTGARAVAITLEDDMDAEVPAGDRVLYGEERMQLL